MDVPAEGEGAASRVQQLKHYTQTHGLITGLCTQRSCIACSAHPQRYKDHLCCWRPVGLLQDLASWLGITELSSTASFPVAMAAFKETLAKVEAANAARSVVNGDTAQLASAIKAAVVRAEDSRLLGDMVGLKRAHKRLADLNRDMWLEHSRRVTNQQELLAGLKAVNQMIQAAAGLRVGPAQAKVVAACRAAIKASNLQAMERVVAGGV